MKPNYFLFISIILSLNAFCQNDTTVPISKENNNLFLELSKKTLISKADLIDLIQTSKNEIDSSTIYFVGGADIQTTLTKGSEIPANTGVGFIFDRIYSNKGKIKLFSSIFTSGYINIASTADTISAEYSNNNITNLYEFGNYILIPSNSRHTASIDFKGYFYKDYSKHFKRKCLVKNVLDLIDGFQFKIVGSNRVMVIDTLNLDATIISLRTGFFHEFIPPNKRIKSDYSIIIGIDYSQRHIFGDIGQHSYDDLREDSFGSKQKSFFGLEYYLAFRIKNLIAEVTLASLWPSDNKDFSGLTNTRMITPIKFVGGFPIKSK